MTNAEIGVLGALAEKVAPGQLVKIRASTLGEIVEEARRGALFVRAAQAGLIDMRALAAWSADDPDAASILASMPVA